MEEIKNFFDAENFKNLATKLYQWLDLTLDNLFIKITYDPIRELLSNPWFWFILIFLFFLSIIFKRR